MARLEEYDALSGGRLSVHTLIVGCLLIFAVASAKAAYEHELPNAEIRMVDAGHFALDEQADDNSGYIRTFVIEHVSR